MGQFAGEHSVVWIINKVGAPLVLRVGLSLVNTMSFFRSALMIC